ncbi:MAG: YraN family protein [Oligoflexus sp.]
MAEWLKKKGCQILKRNFRSVGSELDIVAWKDQQLFIVEVKLRTASARLDYEGLLSRQKKIGLIRGARRFVSSFNQIPKWIRIDLAIVCGPDLSLIDYIPGIISCEQAEMSDEESLRLKPYEQRNGF